MDPWGRNYGCRLATTDQRFEGRERKVETRSEEVDSRDW